MRYRNSKQKPRFKYIKMSLFILLLTAIGVLTNIKLKKEDLIEPATSEIQVFARSIEEEKQKLSVIDAGHGDEDPGRSISNVDEKDLNLQIALKLKSALEEEGYEVMMTRSDDTYLTLTERAEFANEVEADLFISIHQNSYIDDSTVSGIEVYYNESTKTESIRAYDELVVTRKTEMPACLVELGYMTNKSELSLLQSDAYQYKLVTGMVNGINQFFES